MIHLNQAASLALIYVLRATHGTVTMISTEETFSFWNAINQNLKDMESKIHSLTPDYMVNSEELFFLYARDIEGNEYYISKNDEESIKKRKDYIVRTPLDVIIASQEDNALECLGLEKIDGEIVKKESKELTRVKENS